MLLALGAPPALAGEPELFQASARFVPAPDAGAPLIHVVLTTTDADVRVKRRPAPRLRLSSTQRSLTLLEHHPEGKAETDPQYVDLEQPLRFPAELTDEAPREPHGVEATLSFVYCSTSRGWCRKGSTRVEIPIEIR